jgi:mono/diheme cytochrome c family protein
LGKIQTLRILSIQSKRLAILAGLTIVGIGLSANLRAGLQARTDGMGGTEALPVYSSSQARTGMRPYIKECSSCHGENGSGTAALGAPDLTDDVWLYADDENTLRDVINRGRSNEMPAFGSVVTQEEIRALVSYVSGLSDSDK